MRKIAFDVSELLFRVQCPNCGLYFLAAYGKAEEFFEGTLSTCPNCKTVYIYSADGLKPCECEKEEDETPEQFLWTAARCEEYRELASNYYGRFGYEFHFLQNKELVPALDDLNRALAIAPQDERHHSSLREILSSETIKEEWLRSDAEERRRNHSQADAVAISYHIQQAEQCLLRSAEPGNDHIMRARKHEAVDHLLIAMANDLQAPGVYPKVREVMLDLVRIASTTSNAKQGRK